MQNLIAWSIAAVAPFAPVAPLAPFEPLAPSLSRSDPVMVQAVVDGDTIAVASIGRVRLLGIDAPEIGRGFDTSAPFAAEARAELEQLVLRRWVRLEFDGSALDVYNRRLAYVVREDGVFVNAALVRAGLARVTARLPLARLDELKRAEADAQAFHRGMWGASPRIPPTGYTRRSRTIKRIGRSEPRGHPSRVRIPKKNPRAKQAVLPVQPLADLDLRVLHRAGAVDLRSVRTRL